MSKELTVLPGPVKWQQQAPASQTRQLVWGFGFVFLLLAAAVYGIRQGLEHKDLRLQKQVSDLKAAMLEDAPRVMPGRTLDVLLGEEVWQPFCLVPAGGFVMGSPAGEAGRDSHENQVQAMLSQPFWLAKTEVTQDQWRVVMGGSPSTFKGSNLPVENVSWHDAQEFVMRLNAKGILPEGWKFALPTEAQWEHACRAGQAGPYSGGSLDELGWYAVNSHGQTHEVAAKKPNAWGLHDMHGNVSEWCADWFASSLTGGSDPTGATWGIIRVRRGGSWGDGSTNCRSAHRSRLNPDIRLSLVGFRPALVRDEG